MKCFERRDSRLDYLYRRLYDTGRNQDQERETFILLQCHQRQVADRGAGLVGSTGKPRGCHVAPGRRLAAGLLKSFFEKDVGVLKDNLRASASLWNIACDGMMRRLYAFSAFNRSSPPDNARAPPQFVNPIPFERRMTLTDAER